MSSAPASGKAGSAAAENESLVKARNVMRTFLDAQRQRTPQAFLQDPPINSPVPSPAVAPGIADTSPRYAGPSHDEAVVKDDASIADNTPLQIDTNLQADGSLKLNTPPKADTPIQDEVCLPDNVPLPGDAVPKTYSSLPDYESLPDYSTQNDRVSLRSTSSPWPANVKVDNPEQPGGVAAQDSVSPQCPIPEWFKRFTNVDMGATVLKDTKSARESNGLSPSEVPSFAIRHDETSDSAAPFQSLREACAEVVNYTHERPVLMSSQKAVSVGTPVDPVSLMVSPMASVQAAAKADQEFHLQRPKRGSDNLSVSDLKASKPKAQSKKVKAGDNVDNQAQAKANLAAIKAHTDNHILYVPFAGLWDENAIPERIVPEEICDPNARGWVLDAMEHPIVTALEKNADNPLVHHCDIDPTTGNLLPKIHHPETLYNGQAGPCRDQRDLNWRQANMTSALQIVREVEVREKIAELYRARTVEMKKRESPDPEKEEEAEDPWPSADCVLRPARKGDFKYIADIINLESQQPTCPQIFRGIRLGDLEEIHERCKKDNRPFIVAIYSPEEELLDPAKWPKGSEKIWKEFVQFRASRSYSSTPKVVGFAFVDDTRTGFASAECIGSRHTGQIKVAVHPSHRQTLYGTALFDRILISVAPYHRSVIDYKWKCVDPAFIYEVPSSQNKRHYAWVFVEMICPGKESDDYKWRAKMLESFGFREVTFLEQYVRTDRFHQSEWLDLSMWRLVVQPIERIPKESPQGADD